MFVCEQCPSDRHPFTALLAGIPPTARMLQSPAFPRGEADGVALRVLASYVGPLGCPGEKWLISGHLQSRFVAIGGAGVAPLPMQVIGNDEDQSAAFPVKLRIKRCGWPGEVIIDSDRTLVVDGTDEIEIEVIAPSTWLLVPSTATVEVPNTFQYVNLYVTACECECGQPPPSWLTWWANLTDLDAVVRPRRARRVQISTPNPGGATFQWWNGNPATTNAQPLGTFQVNGGFVNTDSIPGAASHLQVTAGAGVATPFMFAWEVA